MTTAPDSLRRADYLTVKHQFLNVLHVLFAHACIVAWFAFAPRFLPAVPYVVLSLVACLIHQRSISEWIHEGAHFNVLRDRKWNEIFVSLLAASVFGLVLPQYRRAHMRHHAELTFFVDADPDTREFIVTRKRDLLHGLLMDLSAINPARLYLRTMFGGGRAAAPGGQTAASGGGLAPYVLAVIFVQAVILTTCLLFGRLDAYVIYYATLVCVYTVLNRVRLLGQHVSIGAEGIGQPTGSTASRTVDAGILDRIFVTSRRMMYHHEHHIHPGLPWRALQAMSRPQPDVNAYCTSRWMVLRAFYKGLA